MEENEQPAPQEDLKLDDQMDVSDIDVAISRKVGVLPRTFQDDKDGSINPSYTNFKIPYHILCRDRYVRSRQMYEQQFQHEIDEMLTQHVSAYEATRFQHHMAISTLWPPLHNRSEIQTVQRTFFRLTRKQQKRLQFIMSRDIT